MSGAQAGLFGIQAFHGGNIALEDSEQHNAIGLTSSDEIALERRCRLIMFWDMQISEQALPEWVSKEISSHHFKYFYIKSKAKTLAKNLQRRMWCNEEVASQGMLLDRFDSFSNVVEY